MTQTHPVQPQPAAGDDTGPLLLLRRQGKTQREIAARLHMSQSTVSRRLREISAVRRTRFWQAAMLAVLTACAVVAAAALATMAW